MKISTSSKVHVFKFSRFVFSRFGRGSQKLRKFGPRENFPLYGTTAGCLHTMYTHEEKCFHAVQQCTAPDLVPKTNSYLQAVYCDLGVCPSTLCSTLSHANHCFLMHYLAVLAPWLVSDYNHSVCSTVVISVKPHPRYSHNLPSYNHKDSLLHSLGPRPPPFYLPFAFTIIHGSGRPAKKMGKAWEPFFRSHVLL